MAKKTPSTSRSRLSAKNKASAKSKTTNKTRSKAKKTKPAAKKTKSPSLDGRSVLSRIKSGIKLTLPCNGYSGNLMYDVSGKRKFRKPAYVQWQKKIKQMTDGIERYKMLGPVKVSVQFTFPDRRVRDLDNYCKTLLDILKDRMFEDDTEIQQLNSRKNFVYRQSRITVIVSRATVDEKGFDKSIRPPRSESAASSCNRELDALFSGDAIAKYNLSK